MQEICQPRNVGAFVREARVSQGLTQRQLAEKAGVSERSVLSLEMGDATGIRLDKLFAILGAVGLRLFVAPEAEPDVSPARDGEVGEADASARVTGGDAGECNRLANAAPAIVDNTSYQQLYNDFFSHALQGDA